MPTWDCPAWIATSGITQPFLRLAQVKQDAIEAAFRQSLLGRLLTGMHGVLITPVQSRLQQSMVPTLFFAVQVIALFATLILATFAGTGLIAKAVGLSFGFMLLRAWTRPFTFKWNMVDVLVALFFLSALVSTCFSSYVHTSLVGMAKFLIFLMGYLSFRTAVGDVPKLFLAFLAVLMGLGLAESMIGAYQYIHHIQPLATWQDPSVNSEDQLTRIFGTLQPANPNLLAGFLIPCLGAGGILGLVSLARRQWVWGMISLLAAGPILGALVLTGSRGGYLSLLMMFLMVFLVLGHLLWHEAALKSQYRLKALWLIILVGAVAGLLGGMLALPAIRNRFLSIFAMRQDSSNSYRLNVWTSTVKMIQDNWLLGIGPGNSTFKQVYGLYMIPGYNALSAYSIFLEIWAEQGIVGFLIFLLLMATLKMRSILTLYGQFSIPRKLLVALTWTTVVGSVMYGLFDTIWYRPSVNLLFWLLVAGFATFSEPIPQPILD